MLLEVLGESFSDFPHRKTNIMAI
jgi:hypothetical protein